MGPVKFFETPETKLKLYHYTQYSLTLKNIGPVRAPIRHRGHEKWNRLAEVEFTTARFNNELWIILNHLWAPQICGLTLTCTFTFTHEFHSLFSLVRLEVQRLSLLLLLLSFPLSLQAFGRFAPQRARVSSMHLSSSKYSLTSQWGVHEWVRVRVREFACECVFLDEHSASIRTQQNKWIVTKKLNSKEFRVSWAKLTAALSLFWGKNRLGKLPFTVFVFLLIFLYTYIWSLVAKRAL